MLLLMLTYIYFSGGVHSEFSMAVPFIVRVMYEYIADAEDELNLSVGQVSHYSLCYLTPLLMLKGTMWTSMGPLHQYFVILSLSVYHVA